MSFYEPHDRSHALDFLWLLLAFVVLYFMLAVGRPHATGPREITFYQDEPACPEKKIVYVMIRQSFGVVGQHRVWICGLSYTDSKEHEQ